MEIQIERSTGRKKTVSARMKGDVMVVSAPADIPEAELNKIIARLRVRIERRIEKSALSDADLELRAAALSRQYFNGKLKPTSVRWVTNQNSSRWASCTRDTGEIRVSHRLGKVPPFVLDAVLVHELVHLAIPHHGPDFWAMANRYPLTERARGYLMAIAGETGEDEM